MKRLRALTSLLVVALFQAEQSQAATVALLGVRLVLENAFDQFTAGFAN